MTPLLPSGPLRGVVPWRANATGGVTSVEFSINGRVVWIDRRAPFAFAAGRGLNTTKLGNGTHVLQVHGIAGSGRYDIARTTVVVDNKAFALTGAGARPWTKVRKTVKLRVRPWGAKAQRIVFRVDGKRRAVDSHAPFLFAWDPKRARPGKHVLEVTATSVDGRDARLRIPVVVSRPKPKLRPVLVPALEIVRQSVLEGQTVSGLIVWKVEAAGGPTRIEFLVDGTLRGSDVAAPYTLGWNTSTEAPGPHRLTARAVGTRKPVEATVTVKVAQSESGGSATP